MNCGRPGLPSLPALASFAAKRFSLSMFACLNLAARASTSVFLAASLASAAAFSSGVVAFSTCASSYLTSVVAASISSSCCFVRRGARFVRSSSLASMALASMPLDASTSSRVRAAPKGFDLADRAAPPDAPDVEPFGWSFRRGRSSIADILHES